MPQLAGRDWYFIEIFAIIANATFPQLRVVFWWRPSSALHRTVCKSSCRDTNSPPRATGCLEPRGYRWVHERLRAASTVFVAEDQVRRGWETVRERYREKYSDRTKMGTLTFSEIEITPLSADAAVVLGRWRLRRANDEPHGRFTLIFRRMPEGWRIVHDHTSAAPPV